MQEGACDEGVCIHLVMPLGRFNTQLLKSYSGLLTYKCLANLSLRYHNMCVKMYNLCRVLKTDISVMLKVKTDLDFV
jgi:hypothetical protein